MRRLSRLQSKVIKVKARMQRLRKYRDPNFVNENIDTGLLHSNMADLDKNRKSRN